MSREKKKPLEFHERIHPQYTKFKKPMTECLDAIEGEDTIKSKTTAYLPMLEGIKRSSKKRELYNKYLQNAIWYPATGRSDRAYKGILFRKQPNMVIPESVSELINSFSDSGQSLTEFTKEVAGNMISNYRPAVLVDFPSVNMDGMNMQEVSESGIRPYAILYKQNQIINWFEEKMNGQKTIKKVLLQESHQVESSFASGLVDLENNRDVVIDNGFITVRRELLLSNFTDENGITFENVYMQKIYVLRKETKRFMGEDKTKWTLEAVKVPLNNGNPLTYIPIVPITENGELWDLKFSLINDLKNLNLADYRHEALYRDALYYVGRPTFCVSGLKRNTDNNDVAVGSNVILQFTEGGSWGIMGGDAESAAALREEASNLKTQLSIVGSRVLMPEKKAAEAAETAKIHRTGEQGTLSSVGNGLTAGMKTVLKYMLEWWPGYNGETEGETVQFKIFTDFVPGDVDPAMLQALLGLLMTGKISNDIFYWNLQRGELLPEGTDIEKLKLDSDKDFKKQLKNQRAAGGSIPGTETLTAE
jgi:hypothetical protein